MRSEVQQYLEGPRDSVRERELGLRLRQVPNPERYEIVQWAISQNVEIGLSLARRSLTRGEHFEAVLRQGLADAQGEEIRLWLYCVRGEGYGPMGVVHFYQVLNDVQKQWPSEIENALHYLPEFFSPNGSAVRAGYALLLRRVHDQAKRENRMSDWLASRLESQF